MMFRARRTRRKKASENFAFCLHTFACCCACAAVEMAPAKSLSRRLNSAPVVLLSLAFTATAAVLPGPVISRAWALCAANALLCWLASLASNEHSWTDRLWSVTPAAYSLLFALDAPCARSALQFALSVLWALRLSWNFFRKGGFEVGEEDYRWAAVREELRRRAPARCEALVWQAFNAAFIASYQHVLLLLIALPAHAAALSPLSFADGLVAACFLLLLLLETAADNQQWRFQQSKRMLAPREKHLASDYENGFLTHGLFALCRHPAFAAEVSVWWCFWLFNSRSIPVGSVLLTALFQGSARFTETLSARKYPAYRLYQQRVPMLWPVWSGRRSTVCNRID